MPRLAIVAALEREVKPLIKGWRVTEKEHQGRSFRFFEDGNIVVVCGGIGASAARRAAEAVIVSFDPEVVCSAGFAGALDPKLRVGDVIRPRTVINAGDASRAVSEVGEGVLVSFDSVASPAQKAQLRDSFGAQAVDMEAAAVAQAAGARGKAFVAVKAVSDVKDFELPAMDRFVKADGRFSEGRFVLYVAIRPWTWLRVMRLARNSSRASRSLCAFLSDHRS